MGKKKKCAPEIKGASAEEVFESVMKEVNEILDENNLSMLGLFASNKKDKAMYMGPKKLPVTLKMLYGLIKSTAECNDCAVSDLLAWLDRHDDLQQELAELTEGDIKVESAARIKELKELIAQAPYESISRKKNNRAQILKLDRMAKAMAKRLGDNSPMGDARFRAKVNKIFGLMNDAGLEMTGIIIESKAGKMGQQILLASNKLEQVLNVAALAEEVARENEMDLSDLLKGLGEIIPLRQQFAQNAGNEARQEKILGELLDVLGKICFKSFKTVNSKGGD